MKKETNYKKWSFKLLIYLILINVAIAYLVYNLAVGFNDMEVFNRNTTILSIIASIILVVGIILTILSIRNKETKNYQYYFSIIGYPIFIFFTVLSLFI
jgi:DMSO/TMAO reductase YedYZ heme-binding membrane subunit